MQKKIENNYIFINPNIALGAIRNKCEQEYICYLIFQKINKYFNKSSGVIKKELVFNSIDMSRRSVERILSRMVKLGFININGNNIYLKSYKTIFQLLFVNYYTSNFLITNYSMLIKNINIFKAREILLASILCSNNLPKSYQHINKITNLSISSIKRLTVNLLHKTMAYKTAKDNLSYNDAEFIKEQIKFSFIKKNKKLYSVCVPIGYIFEPLNIKTILNKYEHKDLKQIRHERLYNDVF